MKPTPDYKLFEEVKKFVLDEPHRVNMWRWWVFRDNTLKLAPRTIGCDSVGCIGGTAEALRPDSNMNAGDLLGLTLTEADALFYFNRTWSAQPLGCEFLRSYSERLIEYNRGTPEYARAVADTIDRFVEYLKEDRAQLEVASV